MKLVSVVLLLIISNKKQFPNLRQKDEQNNELKPWIKLKFKHPVKKQEDPPLWVAANSQPVNKGSKTDELPPLCSGPSPQHFLTSP